MRRFTAAVVGLGRIGQGYDYDRSGGAVIATHASAFTHHDGYELVAGVDPDPVERERFERKFRRPAFADVAALLSRHRPDVVAVGVPTPLHATVFEEVTRGRPLAVVCEKPIAGHRADAEKMLGLAAERGCAVLVNYIRRCEPGARAVKAAIEGGDLGEVYKGAAWYSNGLLHSGSHFVDLLRFWLGDVTGVEIIDEGRPWSADDCEPDVCLTFRKTQIHLLAGREECFSVGEIELVGTRGTIRYARGGSAISVAEPLADATFPGYTVLGREAKTIPTELARYQWHVVEALYRHLIDGSPLSSDGRSATETLGVIEEIFERRGRAR